MTLARISIPVDPGCAPVAPPDRAAQDAAAFPFEDLLADSTTAGEPAAIAVRSVTANAAWSERVTQNLAPFSEPPASVARVIRESYGRILAARPRRFHAHA